MNSLQSPHLSATPQALRPQEHARALGFTLIELLVVISIIALLISILLPSLGAARNAARDMSCMSNLKQMGVGIYSYASDYDGTMPVGFRSTGGGVSGTSWDLLINGYIGGSGLDYSKADPDDNSKIFKCPQSTRPDVHRDYSAHQRLMPDISNSPFKAYRLSQIKRTSTIFSVLDGANAQKPDGNATATSYGVWPSQYSINRSEHPKPSWLHLEDALSVSALGDNTDTINVNDGFARYRHSNNKATNLLFVDGHASTYQRGTILNRNVVAD